MTEIKGERSVVVQAPRDEVFKYVSDFHRHPDWNHQILEIIKDTDGPIGAGTRFRARERPPSKLPLPMKLMFPLMIRMVGIEKYTVAEITEWEPDRSVGWKASAPLRDGGTWMRSEWRIELEALDDSTRVTQHFHYTPVHERARMNVEKATQMVSEEVSQNLEGLKRILESRTRVSFHSSAVKGKRPAHCKSEQAPYRQTGQPVLEVI